MTTSGFVDVVRDFPKRWRALGRLRDLQRDLMRRLRTRRGLGLGASFRIRAVREKAELGGWGWERERRREGREVWAVRWPGVRGGGRSLGMGEGRERGGERR